MNSTEGPQEEVANPCEAAAGKDLGARAVENIQVVI
jgi:hypothetical protein